jgi:deoxyribodipyrimidine photo-lyase
MFCPFLKVDIYMSKKMENGLFIFRRDLRIIDNNALSFLSELCNKIYAIFIFTPEQVSSGNKYKSKNAVQFMIESLEDLSSHIKKSGGELYTFYGHNDSIISECIKAWDINIVAFNLDITPYSRERDHKIVTMCQNMKVFVTYDHDYYLCEPGAVLNGSGQPYQKFTPYYETAKKRPVAKPSTTRIHMAKSSAHIPRKISLESAMKKLVGKENPDILVRGGRVNALKQLRIAAKNIKHYSSTRDELSSPTSQLSAYIKFGCLSIREIYYAFKSNHSFIRQLYWRDFYSNILYSHPRVLGHSLNEKYDKIKWHHNKRFFDAWKTGMTGIPIVDASQRQLLTCGWTHNRGRMISSSILIKILLIDWREGEQFYAQHLVDYDVASNNGGWQFSSGSGADSQPYFRYFNPFTQSKDHDAKCEYIKTWIPELKDVDSEDIHNWDTAWEKHKECGYPKPIVDYKEQREKSIKLYKDALY